MQYGSNTVCICDKNEEKIQTGSTGSQLLRVAAATTYSRAGQIAQMTLKPSFLPSSGTYKWDDSDCLSQDLFLVKLNKHPSRMWKVQQDNFLLFELTLDKRIFTVVIV